MMRVEYTEYQKMETKKDVDVFLNCTNRLHDGYLVSVHYEHNGHTGENPHWIDPTLSELKIRIMITSIENVMVELVFSALSKWQIKDDTFEITDTSVSFTDNGNVIWTDDGTADPDIRKSGSYVIAKTMKWRFL